MTFFWPAAGAEKFWGICTKIGGPPYDGGGSEAKPAHTHVWIRALSAHPPLWALRPFPFEKHNCNLNHTMVL